MTSPEFELIARVIEICSILGGGGMILIRLGRAIERFEQIGQQQGKEISELKDAIRSNNEVIVKVAVQNQLIADLGSRASRMEDSIDDLRRGEGKILPLNPRSLPHER